MTKVSVDLESPSPYVEKDSYLHRIKRNLSYSFALRQIKDKCANKADLSILEIGTGSGFFMTAARREFPRAKLTGIEYDPRLLEATRKMAPFANCMHANAETFDLQPEKFDVVVSFQVIEHLYDPSAMLARAKLHLKPGGIFLVTTPNLDGLGARIMGANWHGYRDDHVSLKGVSAWIDLIQGHGFTRLYSGSTFFSGLPIMNRIPLGIFNWSLLVMFGAARWRHGESFVGVFKARNE
jgi:2-polyprenyl-3-methyl-5-hydroxy-6-metoxy-1,4-benzoquinol methylase